ncbi:MAG: haloalkane dehalogenase [Gammaproteobacteria bacterium]|nr:haloalkane dehalogenase [Gammaproteobacteria bacterium]
MTTAIKYSEVLGRQMAWRETGTGHPIVFLHGNPTSSYMWRNIMPIVAPHGRCLAPDLIGMGHSDKLPGDDLGRYSFQEHRRYLDALLEQLIGNERVTLVLHDWGSGLGFDWARRHPDQVAGICYMEAIVRPMRWAEWPEQSRPLFEALRSPAGEALIYEKNVFIERILPGSIKRDMSVGEMNQYRAPFLQTGADRAAMLAWPRQLPFDDEPAEVVEIIGDYADWLVASEIPKLFINADPGAILTGPLRDFCRTWPNQVEVTVPGIHFIQEDAPHEIGQAIASWMAS